MGYRYEGQCFEALQEVAEQMCAGLTGVSSAGVVRCTGISGAAGGYVLNVETAAPAGTITATQLSVPQLACDELASINDQVELFGLGLLALVGVWCMREFVLKLVMPQ